MEKKELCLGLIINFFSFGRWSIFLVLSGLATDRPVSVSLVVYGLVVPGGTSISFLEDDSVACIFQLEGIEMKSQGDIKSTTIGQILVREVEGNRLASDVGNI